MKLLPREYLSVILDDSPSLQLVAKCYSAFEANIALMENKIDIMFLDINMPKMNGLSFLSSLNKKPAVIITTAFREYALEGFELDVVDYLKKPFSFERFMKSVNKALERIQPKNVNQGNQEKQTKEKEFIFIKEDKTIYKINFDDILFIESIGDYNKIHTEKKTHIAYQTLKKIELVLPGNFFIRVHKSYIVSLRYIDSIDGNQIKIKDKIIPIGKFYRKRLTGLIG
jgi:DNA-binding LytR/AlgR family response regulator